MPYLSLPTIAEDRFKTYLQSNFTGTYQKAVADSAETISAAYSFARLFSTDPLTYPAVIVGIGGLKELTPDSHVYEGKLSIAVITQIDDTADPIAEHDKAVAQIYDLMANREAVKAGVADANFSLLHIYNDGYEQSLDRGERDVKTLLEFVVNMNTQPSV
jgi:hypothetical protein